MPDAKDLAVRLAAELEQQFAIQAKLGTLLIRKLRVVETDGEPVYNADGAEIDRSYVPGRDWARCYGHYRGANATMLLEERERTKLRLMMDKGGQQMLTDAEYEQELKQLKRDAMDEQTTQELAEYVRARGLTIADPKPDD